MSASPKQFKIDKRTRLIKKIVKNNINIRNLREMFKNDCEFTF